jgi:3-hydroxybutyryl-CoA dehydrogenase
MSEPGIRRVLVAGAGSIGIGVTRSFADSGYETSVLTRDPARFKGQLDGVALVTVLPADMPDLVVECLPEVAELKTRFFAQVEDAYGGVPILASNTSGLSLQDLAASLRYRRRFLGMHYLFPAHLPGLFVEVIRTLDTSDEVVATVISAMEKCGKLPILLKRPVIGGLFNRLQHAILREAYYMIDQGIATAEEIDAIARNFIAPRMCITALLRQKDISGLDTHTLAHEAILPHLCNDRTPSKVLQSRYERGQFGLKTGKGFYDWSGAVPDQVRSTTNARAARIRKLMQEMESDDNA